MMNLDLPNMLRNIQIYCKHELKFDFTAAIVVFLVAIPLCLGIALASGAPLLSGILSGVIGGCVVGVLSGSHVSVAGPSPGICAVVLAVITQLGGFEPFLLALFIAGIYQMIAGLFRAGFIADYIPSNVVQGLLSAVGLLIIIKEVPFAFTLSHSIANLKTELLDIPSGFSLEPLKQVSIDINSGAIILSLSSLLILIYFEKTKQRWLRSLSGPFVVVILGIIVNEIFILTSSSLAQLGPNLVNIPQQNSFADFIGQLQSPDWSTLKNPQVYVSALFIASVASLENLLNIKASERLDLKHRYCSKDRELIVQGIGNVLAGLIGAIPITTVIVRTYVNIEAGAKTKGATIMHGIFILLAMLLIPNGLSKIPLSSLAGVLVFTGYKLTKPSIYRAIYRQGLDRFIPFITTVVCILIFNILIGILAGLFISLFFILKSNSQLRLDIIKELYPQGTINRLILPQQTTFLNKGALLAELESIPKHSELVIDARYSEYIDKEIIEFIKEYQTEEAPQKHISLNLIGFKDSYQIKDQIHFISVTTFQAQSLITAQQALNILQEGNTRFKQDKFIPRNIKSDINQTATTQYPIAVVLGCMDSRVPVETIFDVTFGDLFCIRIAGNIVNDDVLASIEYACKVIRAKLIVVLGHTGCGAIQAACNNVETGFITQLLAKIKPAIEAETATQNNRTGTNMQYVQNITELNIANTIQSIYHNSPILEAMINQEEIGIVGAIYDVHSGAVDFQNFSALVNQLNNADSAKLIEKLTKTMSAG